MVLTTASNVFGDKTPYIDSDGYMSIAGTNNYAKSAVITNANTGTIPGLFDGYTSTYLGVTATDSGATINFDLGKRRNNVVIQSYWGGNSNNASIGWSINLQYSLDNTNWTTIDTLSFTVDATKYQNSSSQISARYIRWNMSAANQGNHWCRIYSLTISKVIEE